METVHLIRFKNKLFEKRTFFRKMDRAMFWESDERRNSETDWSKAPMISVVYSWDSTPYNLELINKS